MQRRPTYGTPGVRRSVSPLWMSTYSPRRTVSPYRSPRGATPPPSDQMVTRGAQFFWAQSSSDPTLATFAAVETPILSGTNFPLVGPLSFLFRLLSWAFGSRWRATSSGRPEPWDRRPHQLPPASQSPAGPPKRPAPDATSAHLRARRAGRTTWCRCGRPPSSRSPGPRRRSVAAPSNLVPTLATALS